MQQRLRPTSFTFDLDVLAELRRVAHQESLESGREVTASSIVRDLVEKFLAERQQRFANAGT